MQNSLDQFECDLKYIVPMDPYLFSSKSQVFTLTWCGQTIAVKKAITERGEEHLRREAGLLKDLSHPNIVGFHIYSDRHKAMGIEYLDNHDVMMLLQNQETYHLSSNDRKHILYSVASALDYLHNRRIIFNDLKPENIFVGGWLNRQNTKVKLGDFGLSIELDPDETKITLSGRQGTPEYLAPEMINDYVASRAVDSYAYGCVVYEIQKRIQPFKGTFSREREYKIDNQGKMLPLDLHRDLREIHISHIYGAVISGQRAPFTYGVDGPWGFKYEFCSPEVCLDNDTKDLIRACWAHEPESRLSFQAVLGHSFFRSYRDLDAVEEDNQVKKAKTTDCATNLDEQKEDLDASLKLG